MIDIDTFVNCCIDLVQKDNAEEKIKDLMEDMLSNPLEFSAQFEKMNEAKIDTIYHSNKLTIVNLVWAPRMSRQAHNHNLWAVIGVYSGVEENIFYSKTDDHRITETGDLTLSAGDVVSLGKDAIHSVKNPSANQPTGGIHVYGGDHFGVARSEWRLDSMEEIPYDTKNAFNVFRRANENWQKAKESFKKHR